MKKSYFFISIFLFISLFGKATDGRKLWSASYQKQKVFIENKGQFRIAGDETNSLSKVKYAYDGGSTNIYFTPKGITYSFLKTWKGEENDNEENEKEAILYGKSHSQMESEEHKLEFETDVVTMNFENANPNVELLADYATTDYHSYSFKENNQLKNINNVKAFKKITYKNIYPNIDIEYTFHSKSGLKYTIILHPGGDISLLKTNYSGKVKGNKSGEILIKSKFGDIIDHAPLTFYEGNTSEIISSHFINTNNSVSFYIGNYDRSKTVIIDPWVQTPNFATNWDCVWECDKDGAGNVYLIGGVAPMQLLKYDSLGTLQWTYNTPYDTSSWLGTMATDLAGNSYVTMGSVAEIIKVNTSGGLVWTNPNPGTSNMGEFWSMAFNCDQTKLTIGGTGGSFLPIPYVYNVDMNNGSILNSKIVGSGGSNPAYQEVRAVSPAPNGRLYFLTHDSIGSIDQNPSLWATGNTLNKINSGYHLAYKCENFRIDNSGICAIKANGNYVYSQNGSTLHKRLLSTGAIIASVTIPGGSTLTSVGQYQVANSGIDIDNCGNVYVGSTNAVIKYDANLNLLSSSPTTFNVYDVAVNYGGKIIAAGTTGNQSTTTVRTGKIQSINMGACSPIVLACCDATISASYHTMCVTDTAITLITATSGGTWSGAGVNSLGVFFPSVAGVGSHTIYYTLACGQDSSVIQVLGCVPLTVCRSTNGSLNVSGGTGTYNWQTYIPGSVTSITNQATCTACGGTWFFGSCQSGSSTITSCTTPGYWSTFATGSTVTPTAGYPLQIIDNGVGLISIPSFASVPQCISCPTLPVIVTNQVNDTCAGQTFGNFTATASNGVLPYNFTLTSGATTLGPYTSATGIYNFTGLGAGTYNLSVSDSNSCPGTASVTITQPGLDSAKICMVTVDSLSQYNVIIWDKISFTNVDSFLIYRENSLNNYQIIAAIPFSALSEFVDTVRHLYFPATGNPNIGTYRYKIKARDVCGNYGPLSPYHNTILITNSGGTFSWNPLYTIENGANPVSSYVLTRDDNSTGNWQPVGSVAGNQFSISDPQYATYQATASWRVITNWNISCTPTRSFTSSLSNLLSNNPTVGISPSSAGNLISIYPNPFTFQTTISFSSEQKNTVIKITDVIGQEVKFINFSGKQCIIEKGELRTGVYFVQIIDSNKNRVNRKVVVE